MSTNQPDIKQIRKYLNGELDARAMYELERRAHQDPFLWDVIKGMESSDENHQPRLDAIGNLIKARVEERKRRIVPMWTWSAAASLLIALGIGGWLFMRQPTVPVVLTKAPNAAPADKVAVLPADTQHTLSARPPVLAKLQSVRSKPETVAAHNKAFVSSAEADLAIVKADTPANSSKGFIANNTVNELLKKTPGVDVNNYGAITSQGRELTKVKLNGKLFFGGDTKAAAKNLPADVVDKIQVVDAYGDQASKTGIKIGEPAKVLNVQIRGTASIAAKKPLYIVDGLPVENFDLNKLKADEIKRIDILKDTSATAIYGYRAAEGVVLVTTKKGESFGLKEVSIVPAKPEGIGTRLSLKRNIKDSVNNALAGRVAGLQITANKSKSNIGQSIVGRVFDQTDRNPIPGAYVYFEGTKIATHTDQLGAFTIDVPGENAKLVIASIGYENKQVRVKGTDSVKVALSPNNKALAEVVVVGYGTQKNEAELVDAHPQMGWKAYNAYLKAGAVLQNSKPGTVKLFFTVEPGGAISNIKVVSGLTETANKKAIEMVQNGPVWIGGSDGKPQQVKLKIKFHK